MGLGQQMSMIGVKKNKYLLHKPKGVKALALCCFILCLVKTLQPILFPPFAILAV